ncbi:MAG: Fic family protein [Microthrixaceae bacterium]
MLDFLVIHPFEDGNGRVARIMTTALLERDDYQVGRYVPIEALIAERGDEYKAALGASTANWHDSTHDVWPWTSFFVDMLAMAYDTFTETVRRGLMDPTELVHDWLRAKAPPGFSMAEARRALPALSPHAITTALNAARDSGELRLTGHGRGARWHLVDPGK